MTNDTRAQSAETRAPQVGRGANLALDRRTVAWIRRRLPVGRPRRELPRFGSSEWHALDDLDPRKMAAVIVSAACWWDSCRPARIAQDIEDELIVAQQLQAQRFAGVAHDVRRRANSPTWAEIRRRWAS